MKKRSRGWDIRETEIASIGSSAIFPQPISQNAPKDSICVILAFIISPSLFWVNMYSLQSCCAFLRDRTAHGLPFSSLPIAVTAKHTGFPTREISAISRVEPSAMPIAPSSLGIIPFICPKSIIRLCAASHISAVLSSTVCFACASARKAGVNAFLLSVTCVFHPSGKKPFII